VHVDFGTVSHLTLSNTQPCSHLKDIYDSFSITTPYPLSIYSTYLFILQMECNLQIISLRANWFTVRTSLNKQQKNSEMYIVVL